jgi:transposase
VPAEILYDRMRTVFRREDPDAGHIIYNRTLIDFARHYGYLPKAGKAYRAKTKGKVEGPFRYGADCLALGDAPSPAARERSGRHLTSRYLRVNADGEWTRPPGPRGISADSPQNGSFM